MLVLGAQRRGANAFGVDVGPILVGAVLGNHLRPAGLHVDVACPVHFRIVFFCNQQFARNTVQRVAESVTIEVHQRLARLTLDLDVRQDHLIDAVVIPFVVRCHLIDPFRLAGIQIPREDRHRPFVVARTLAGVPGARVAAAVVHQVEGRVIAVPAPGRATADLPLIAFPGLERRVLAYRRHLAVGPGHRLVRVHQHCVVRSGAVCLPDFFAGIDVVRGHPTAHAKFPSADPGEDLVLEDMRRVGGGFADLRIAGLDFPDLFAALRIQRNQRGVGLLQEHLPVGVCHASIDCVAAHHGDHARVLLRLVLPFDFLVFEAEREYLVGERAVHIHRVTNHQRTAFVAAQHSCREGPRYRQVLGVVLVDLLQFTVALIG